VTDFPPPGEPPANPTPFTPPLSSSAPPPPPLTPPPPAPGWWQASDGNWYPPETAPGYRQPTAYGPPPGSGPPTAYGGAGYGYTPYAANRGINGLAIASFVLGILWLEWIGSVLALVFGYIALSQIKQRHQGGRGFAIAGIVFGWVALAALLLVAVLMAATNN
jgi:hypothetical protein